MEMPVFYLYWNGLLEAQVFTITAGLIWPFILCCNQCSQLCIDITYRNQIGQKPPLRVQKYHEEALQAEANDECWSSTLKFIYRALPFLSIKYSLVSPLPILFCLNCQPFKIRFYRIPMFCSEPAQLYTAFCFHCTPVQPCTPCCSFLNWNLSTFR